MAEFLLTISIQYQYNINTTSSTQKIRIKKNIRGLLVDPILNSLNKHHYVTIWQTTRRITNEILGVKGLNESVQIICFKKRTKIYSSGINRIFRKVPPN